MKLQNKFESVIEPFSKNGFMFVHPSDIAEECTKLCIEELTKLVKEVVHTTYEALDSNFSDKSYNKAIEESLKLINKYETNLG